jgi:ketosteroid isomerase-like protein
MNEQNNTALIQSVYDAFKRGDIPFILGNLTGDCQWESEGPETIPYTGNRRGAQEILGFFAALGGTLDDMKLTTDHFVAQGDAVTTFGRFAGTVKATGKKFDTPVAHYFQIRDGKIAVFVDIVETASVAAAYQGSAAAAR